MTLSTVLRTISSPLQVRGIPRLLFSTRRWVLGTKPRIFDMGQNIEMMLDPNDYFQCMMFYGRYGLDIRRLFDKYVHSGDTVLDIGSQIGYFSLYLASLVGPSGRVYAFEPDPRAAEYLHTSRQASGMDWISIMPMALSASDGTMDFFLSPVLGWSTGVKETHLTNLEKTCVARCSLDSLVERGIIHPGIRLAKIDVEGFEFEVLKGMQRTLENIRPIIIMEINSKLLAYQGTGPDEIFQFLKSVGYEVQPHTDMLPDDSTDVLCCPT